MKSELVAEFSVPAGKVSVIPFGINNTVSTTKLSTEDAKRSLRISRTNKTMLFFGHIAPYKGLEYLVAALQELTRKDENYRLIIAGTPKGCEEYWEQIKQGFVRMRKREQIIERIEYIPDDQTELYFKAADVLILPYRHIFQSGVLFLGYNFGLPAIAADVGSLREDIVEGRTGYIFQPNDTADLAKTIEAYFSSPLYRELETQRHEIRDYANERYSWVKAGKITSNIYQTLLAQCSGRSGGIHG